MDDIQFPKILGDIARLKAENRALRSMFFYFVNDLKPEDHKRLVERYAALARTLFEENLLAIPEIDEALREELRRQLDI